MSENNQIWVRRKNAGGKWHLLEIDDNGAPVYPANLMKCGAKINAEYSVFKKSDKRMSKNSSNTCPKCLVSIESTK